jgi:hypothetical protein
MEDLDYKNWPPRSCSDHRTIAEEWRMAPDEISRDELFEEHGIRWTELLRLPYWDPTRFVLIDSMHAFLLGMLKRHIREIWGMDVHFRDGDGKSFQPKKPPTDKDMREAHKTLRVGSRTALGKLTAPVLRQLCRDTGSMRFAYKRKRLLANLLEYVRSILILVIFDRDIHC